MGYQPSLRKDPLEMSVGNWKTQEKTSVVRVAEKPETAADSPGWGPGRGLGAEGAPVVSQTHHLAMRTRGCWAAAL